MNFKRRCELYSVINPSPVILFLFVSAPPPWPRSPTLYVSPIRRNRKWSLEYEESALSLGAPSRTSILFHTIIFLFTSHDLPVGRPWHRRFHCCRGKGPSIDHAEVGRGFVLLIYGNLHKESSPGKSRAWYASTCSHSQLAGKPLPTSVTLSTHQIVIPAQVGVGGVVMGGVMGGIWVRW